MDLTQLADSGVQLHAKHWIYVIGPGVGEPFKVGRTHNLANRMNNLQSGNHRRLLIHIALETENPHSGEGRLKAMFANDRILNEWFEWSDAVAEFIAAVESGCGRTIRKAGGTGHCQTDKRFLNFTKRVSRNRAKRKPPERCADLDRIEAEFFSHPLPRLTGPAS